jgi:hypothetical protein
MAQRGLGSQHIRDSSGIQDDLHKYRLMFLSISNIFPMYCWIKYTETPAFHMHVSPHTQPFTV